MGTQLILVFYSAFVIVFYFIIFARRFVWIYNAFCLVTHMNKILWFITVTFFAVKTTLFHLNHLQRYYAISRYRKHYINDHLGKLVNELMKSVQDNLLHTSDLL